MRKTPLIYILGTSFSGSTLLGFVLGSSRRVFNLGEVKIIEKFRHARDCSCGESLKECPFWSAIDFEETPAAPQVGRLRKALGFAGTLVGGGGAEPGMGVPERFLDNAYASARRIEPDLHYLLDASKSLWRLTYLMRCPNVDLRIVYLERDVHGAVSSFVKHGDGFWRGLLIHKINNFLIRNFLRRRRIDHIHVDYGEFCAHPEKCLREIGRYLSIDFGDYAADVRQREFHVLTGNAGTREGVLHDFSGVTYDDSWKRRLTGFQKTILDSMSGRDDTANLPVGNG